MVVDRPRSVHYSYESIEALIGFRWGLPSNDVPLGLRIEIRHADGSTARIEEDFGYESFDDAVNKGKAHVRDYARRFVTPQSS